MVPPVKGRPTFSLFGMGGSTKTVSTASKATTVATPKTASAPRGVPTINKWKLNGDNTISGLISGSGAFKDGEAITTSAIVGAAKSNSVVQTGSRSKYFLGEEETSKDGGIFSLFGGGGGGEKAAAPAAVKPAPIVKKSAPVKQVDTGAAERKRIAEQAASEKKRKAEEITAERQRKAEGKFCCTIENNRAHVILHAHIMCYNI